MHPKSPKWLQDIADACALIRRATQDQTLVVYEQDAVVRSAVERNFEIIGEALNRIRRTDPETAARVPEHDDIIAFRNLLIHGYDVIDHVRVWQVIQADLPRLQGQVQELLEEIGPRP
jgi:uncharacterized protein with HEPN domain